MVVSIAEICRIGEGKRVHQVEYLQDEQLIIALTGRQRQMRLIPIRQAQIPRSNPHRGGVSDCVRISIHQV